MCSSDFQSYQVRVRITIFGESEVLLNSCWAVVVFYVSLVSGFFVFGFSVFFISLGFLLFSFSKSLFFMFLFFLFFRMSFSKKSRYRRSLLRLRRSLRYRRFFRYRPFFGQKKVGKKFLVKT